MTLSGTGCLACPQPPDCNVCRHLSNDKPSPEHHLSASHSEIPQELCKGPISILVSFKKYNVFIKYSLEVVDICSCFACNEVRMHSPLSEGYCISFRVMATSWWIFASSTVSNLLHSFQEAPDNGSNGSNVFLPLNIYKWFVPKY